MTIHDILVNCGSVQSDTLIIIVSETLSVERKFLFKNLETKYETLHFKFFTVGFIMQYCKPKLFIKFYL